MNAILTHGSGRYASNIMNFPISRLERDTDRDRNM